MRRLVPASRTRRSEEVPIAALHDRRKRPPIHFENTERWRGMALSAALCGQFHRRCESRLHDHNQRQRSFLSTPIGCAHCPKRWRTGRAQHFPAAAPRSLYRGHAWRPGQCAPARVFAHRRLASRRRRKYLGPGTLHAKYANCIAALPRGSGSSRETQELVLELRNRAVATWRGVTRQASKSQRIQDRLSWVLPAERRFPLMPAFSIYKVTKNE